AFQVFGSGHDIKHGLAQTPGDDAGILQLSGADSDVEVFRDQIDEQVRDEKLDPDTRMIFQESGYEIQKRFLTQNDWNGDPEQTFRSLLRLRQHPLSFLQQIQWLLALAEVILPLSSQGHPPRGPPQERHAEL